MTAKKFCIVVVAISIVPWIFILLSGCAGLKSCPDRPLAVCTEQGW